MSNLNINARVRKVKSRANVVLGFRFHAWNRLNLPKPLPKELVEFQPIKGQKHTAISTPGDLHFHIQADNKIYCIDMAHDISAELATVADCIEEVNGFRYWDGQSILGFFDGTENPHGIDGVFSLVVGEELKNIKAEVIFSFKSICTT